MASSFILPYPVSIVVFLYAALFGFKSRPCANRRRINPNT
jgi:hypothetical protein